MHTVGPFCPWKYFSVQCKQEDLGGPIILSTLQGVWPRVCRPQCLFSHQGSHSNFLAMLADSQALNSRPGYAMVSRAWDKLSVLSQARPPVTSHALSRSLGQLVQTFMLPQPGLCVEEFSCLLLFTVFGAPLEWQVSMLAVDSVM